jgi:hypothetical protein
MLRLTASLGVAASLLWSTSCGLSANEIVSDVRSPDEKLRAVVFRRDSDFTLHVSILRAAEPLTNDSGNVFRAANDGKVPPLEVKVPGATRIIFWCAFLHRPASIVSPAR